MKPDSAIDRFLPGFDHNEVHHVRVKAPPEAVFAAIKEMRPAELSPLVFLLLNLRHLPGKLLGRRESARFDDQPFLDQLYQGGFIPLAEEEGEIVFGMIEQFWKLAGGQDTGVRDARGFLDFHRPDFPRVATNLRVVPAEEGSLLSTETRLWSPDEETRRKVSFYWRCISFGSGWIRIMWLGAIRRRAERSKSRTVPPTAA